MNLILEWFGDYYDPMYKFEMHVFMKTQRDLLYKKLKIGKKNTCNWTLDEYENLYSITLSE